MRLRAVIAVALLAAACSPQRYGVSVLIDGWENDTIFVDTYRGVRDTVVAGKKIRFEVPDTMLFAVISRPADRAHTFLKNAPGGKTMLFVPDGKLKIRGVAREKYVDYRVKGSMLNVDMAEYYRTVLPITLESDSLQSVLIANLSDPQARKRIEGERAKSNTKMYDADLDFVREHPSSEWSLFLLSGKPDEYDEYLPLLTEGAREGRFKPLLEEMMGMMDTERQREENEKRNYVGKPAPDFEATDMDGKAFTLAEYNSEGKYIVLDFWGSWCVPCIHGMPRMKECYEANKDRLEIIGVACYDKEDSWKKAVAENALPWVNVLDNDSAPVNYGLSMYPTKIILSPDKQVVGVYPGEGDQFYNELDELLNK